MGLRSWAKDAAGIFSSSAFERLAALFYFLPEARKSSFGWFVTALVLYSGLLALITALE